MILRKARIRPWGVESPIRKAVVRILRTDCGISQCLLLNAQLLSGGTYYMVQSMPFTLLHSVQPHMVCSMFFLRAGRRQASKQLASVPIIEAVGRSIFTKATLFVKRGVRTASG